MQGLNLVQLIHNLKPVKPVRNRLVQHSEVSSMLPTHVGVNGSPERSKVARLVSSQTFIQQHRFEPRLDVLMKIIQSCKMLN